MVAVRGGWCRGWLVKENFDKGAGNPGIASFAVLVMLVGVPFSGAL
jgi:hypothetical protein